MNSQEYSSTSSLVFGIEWAQVNDDIQYADYDDRNRCRKKGQCQEKSDILFYRRYLRNSFQRWKGAK